jgi:multiple antibiotic resistance protein
MLINYLIIMGLKQVRRAMRSRKFQIAFDKIMELLLRINGFFLGAIGVDMVTTGVSNLVRAAGQAQP